MKYQRARPNRLRKNLADKFLLRVVQIIDGESTEGDSFLFIDVENIAIYDPKLARLIRDRLAVEYQRDTQNLVRYIDEVLKHGRDRELAVIAQFDLPAVARGAGRPSDEDASGVTDQTQATVPSAASAESILESRTRSFPVDVFVDSRPYSDDQAARLASWNEAGVHE